MLPAVAATTTQLCRAEGTEVGHTEAAFEFLRWLYEQDGYHIEINKGRIGQAEPVEPRRSGSILRCKCWRPWRRTRSSRRAARYQWEQPMGALASDFVNQKKRTRDLAQTDGRPDQRPPRRDARGVGGRTALHSSGAVIGVAWGRRTGWLRSHASYTQKSSTYHTPSCRARCRSKMNVKPPRVPTATGQKMTSSYTRPSPDAATSPNAPRSHRLWGGRDGST